MRKNIRRSLMVAAAASGIWALSTAGASAAELPVPSGTVGGAVDSTSEQVEKAGDAGAGSAQDSVRGTEKTAKKAAKSTAQKTTGTVEDAVRGVAGKLPSKGIPENGLPTNTLPTGGLPAGAAHSGAADRAAGELHGTGAHTALRRAEAAAEQAFDHTGHASKAVKEARKDLGPVTDVSVPGVPAVPGVPGVPAVPAVPPVPAVPAVPGGVIRHLPPHTLPAASLPGAPAVPGAPAHLAVPAVPGTGELAGKAGATGLPGDVSGVLEGDHAQDTVHHARNAVSVAHPVLDGAAGEVLPPAARGVAVHIRPVAYQIATDAAVTADSAAATTAPFVAGTYVRTEALAGDVTGELSGFGGGVASDAVPYAHALGEGLHRNAEETASHVVTDVTLALGSSRRDLTDPANIPGMRATSQLPAVPAI